MVLQFDDTNWNKKNCLSLEGESTAEKSKKNRFTVAAVSDLKKANTNCMVFAHLGFFF
jgi:hypothetical protein